MHVIETTRARISNVEVRITNSDSNSKTTDLTTVASTLHKVQSTKSIFAIANVWNAGTHPTMANTVQQRTSNVVPGL